MILENLRKINICECVVGLSTTTIKSSDDVLSFRFRIYWSSLSKPLSTKVLVKPLSQRYLGHFCCNHCIPLYHSLTHIWQPIGLLHSLHSIRGSLAGILLQIMHEKASSNFSKKDTLNLCLNARSWNFFISLFTSWISSDNISSCVWIPLLSVGNTICLLFIGGSVISISCFSSPSILIRSRCSSTNLFGTENTLRDPIFQKVVPYEKVITK